MARSINHIKVQRPVPLIVKKTPIILIFLVFTSLSTAVQAQTDNEELNQRHIWGSFDVGLGHIQRSQNEIEDDDNNFFLGFTAGYKLNPHLLIGVELSGLLFKAASDINHPDTEGEGLRRVLLVTRYYPVHESDWFLKIGGGYVTHWNNQPGKPARQHGESFSLGFGYDIFLNKSWSITPFLNYSFGDVGNQKHKAFIAGIGCSWQ